MHGPPGFHLVAVRNAAQSNGIARLSKPPQEAPDAEQRQRIDEGVRGDIRHRLEHDAEQSRGAGEVALPDRMTRIGFERGMQHARDFRARREPARDRQRGLLMVHQPHPHACAGRAAPRNTSSGPAQSAVESNAARRSFQQRSFAETSAEQQVGMAAEIFGAGLDRDIDAVAHAAGRTAASPRYCPSARSRRARARPRRSPECPASRTTASPAPR